MTQQPTDICIVGAGPNGLSAGILLALQGLSVLLLEEKEEVGGGVKSSELTLPGFIHDVCSAIHPLACGSPFFRRLPLSSFGLEWVKPPAPLAHPLENGTCVLLQTSLEETAKSLALDGDAYYNLFAPFVKQFDKLEDFLFGPLTIPSHPLLSFQFAMKGMRSAVSLANAWFQHEEAKALFAGMAAHAILPLEKMITSAAALVLGIGAHRFNWPFPRGGAKSLSTALAAYLQSLGGAIHTGCSIQKFEELPQAKAYLFDLTPPQLLKIAGPSLSSRYHKQLQKFRFGPGVFKMDWALSEPIPWKAADCKKAATVHIGGTMKEIARSEQEVWQGKHPEKPYVLLAQHTLFDPSRAPAGKHTAWGYCHVPKGSTVDMTAAIEQQIERFAPGFRDTVLARSTKNTQEMQAMNANLIDGDITGGVQDIWQLYTRPSTKLVPYATSHPQLFLCSSSTPPGGGVHGMCGFHAAKAVLAAVFGINKINLPTVSS